MPEPLLLLDEVDAGYGAATVLQSVSLQVDAGATVALLGRNGAGKTTTLRAIMGLLPDRNGRIVIGGKDVVDWHAHRIARLGVGYVPEDRRVFPSLTVAENLALAARSRSGRDGPSLDDVYDLFPRLGKLQRSNGAHLSGGEQQMLAIGRALMVAPRVLLLDEPTEGLAPVLVAALQGSLAQITGTGIAILLADQKVDFALGISDRAYVIDRGEIRSQGTVEELRSDPEVLERYLAVG